jgi:hypothetical protein
MVHPAPLHFREENNNNTSFNLQSVAYKSDFPLSYIKSCHCLTGASSTLEECSYTIVHMVICVSFDHPTLDVLTLFGVSLNRKCSLAPIVCDN